MAVSGLSVGTNLLTELGCSIGFSAVPSLAVPPQIFISYVDSYCYLRRVFYSL